MRGRSRYYYEMWEVYHNIGVVDRGFYYRDLYMTSLLGFTMTVLIERFHCTRRTLFYSAVNAIGHASNVPWPIHPCLSTP